MWAAGMAAIEQEPNALCSTVVLGEVGLHCSIESIGRCVHSKPIVAVILALNAGHGPRPCECHSIREATARRARNDRM